MIDTDEKVDARTVEEDMETRNNMNWLNNRVVELEAEVKRLREEVEHLLTYRDIVEEYDGFFAPEDHTSRWQLLMELIE